MKSSPCQDQHLPTASVLFHISTSKWPQGRLVEEGNVWFVLAKISPRVQSIFTLLLEV